MFAGAGRFDGGLIPFVGRLERDERTPEGGTQLFLGRQPDDLAGMDPIERPLHRSVEHDGWSARKLLDLDGEVVDAEHVAVEIVTERSSNSTLSGWAIPTPARSTQITPETLRRAPGDRLVRPIAAGRSSNSIACPLHIV